MVVEAARKAKGTERMYMSMLDGLCGERAAA